MRSEDLSNKSKKKRRLLIIPSFMLDKAKMKTCEYFMYCSVNLRSLVCLCRPVINKTYTLLLR